MFSSRNILCSSSDQKCIYDPVKQPIRELFAKIVNDLQPLTIFAKVHHNICFTKSPRYLNRFANSKLWSASHCFIARIGLMHIGVFILLLLSGERNFGKKSLANNMSKLVVKQQCIVWPLQGYFQSFFVTGKRY